MSRLRRLGAVPRIPALRGKLPPPQRLRTSGADRSADERRARGRWPASRGGGWLTAPETNRSRGRHCLEVLATLGGSPDQELRCHPYDRPDRRHGQRVEERRRRLPCGSRRRRASPTRRFNAGGSGHAASGLSWASDRVRNGHVKRRLVPSAGRVLGVRQMAAEIALRHLNRRSATGR